MKSLLRAPCFLILALTLAPGASQAQALNVSPVRVELGPQKATTTISVTNRGTEATGVQIRPYVWAQRHNADQLTPTRDLLVSPPIMTIGPGQTHLVRLVLRKPAHSVESSYRIVLDQLPSVDGPPGVKVLLRISMPVFALPVTKAYSHLAWRARATGPGKAEVEVMNSGGRHVQIGALLARSDLGSVSVEGGANLYVLPGATRRVSVSATTAAVAEGASLRMLTKGGQGEDVVIQRSN